MKTPLIFSAAACAAFLYVTPPASAQVAGFSDIPRNHWAADSVAKLVTAGVLAPPSAKPAAGAKKGGYDGNKPVTRYELAVTLYRFVQYLEKANKQPKTKMGAQALPQTGAEAVRRLIASGYLPAKTPLAKSGDKAVTANELADALAQVLAASRVKKTPITPESLRTLPIEKPGNAPGT